MFRFICIVLLFLFSVTPSYSLQVKTAALVGTTSISTQDVHGYQALMSMLGVEKLSYYQALQQMIDLELHYQYAQRIGIRFSQRKYDAALKRIRELGIREVSTTPLFGEYLKKQIFLSEIVDNVVRPSVHIDKDDIDSMKRQLLKKRNAFKLRKISKGGSKEELGWLTLDGLQPPIKEAVSHLAIGKTSEEVGGSRFQVLDKENAFILSIEYKGLVSPKSDVVGMHQTLYSGKISELQSTDRKNLFLLEHEVEVKKREGLILVLALDSEELHSRLSEMIYSEKLEKAVKRLASKLREGIRVVEYQSE